MLVLDQPLDCGDPAIAQLSGFYCEAELADLQVTQFASAVLTGAQFAGKSGLPESYTLVAVEEIFAEIS